ncbi:MAG TPA: phosphoribosylanthranilate isomerase [Thermoanaerobaculia bacterium]|nr:phosphoribosylanthranilate isomerase [Thermoanaerobaculia bacterium]
MSRPLVKICGVTRLDDALAAVDLGADLVGLNFHPASPRCLTAERAAEIAAAVRERGERRTLLVGVFVARPAAEIAALDAAVGLDLVQLHGDQSPAEAAAWGARALPVVRVARDAPPPPAELAAALAARPAAWGFLFDVRHESLWGGSGESWRWEAIAGLADPRPRLVAGGIGPDEALRALAASGAAGVDVCSGVESAPGIKDRRKMERLFAALAAA